MKKLYTIGLAMLMVTSLSACGGGGGGSSSTTSTTAGGSTTTTSSTTTTLTPIADAGPDRTGVTAQNTSSPDTQEILFLDGSASTATEVSWTVTSNPTSAQATLTSTNTPVTGFYADTPGDYVLTLQVGNGSGLSDTDTVTVKLIDDMDGDGLEDSADLDKDGDGFLNSDDLFPTNKAAHYDTNNDGISNYATTDVDGDGTSDINDDFPLDATRTTYSSYSETTETSASNSNDGITVSENAGTVPRKITGAISATGNIVDIDYYKITFNTTGRFSVVLTGATTAMSPSIAVMDITGTPVNTTSGNMPLQGGMAAISIAIAATGDYYLSALDTSGSSSTDWTYTIKIFPDEDLDGVPDDLEKAIDANHLTADSDGDSIPDFIEINQAINNWSNYKDGDSDGLPCWWDLDSDGDGIADAVEYITKDDRPDLTTTELAALNDVDDDGVPNFLDTDSDGNGVSDASEVGSNPTNPDDTDQDQIPDFLDTDDDGDGLLDVNEISSGRLTPMDPAETATAEQAGAVKSIASLYNSTLKVDNLAQSGNSVAIKGYNLPTTTSGTWIILRGTNAVMNIRPTSAATDSLDFTWPDDISSGQIEVLVASSGTHTNSIPVMIPASTAPILTGVSIDAYYGQVTLTGENLDDDLTIHLTGADTTAYGSSGSVTFYMPYGAVRGEAYVTSSGGDSNMIWLDLARNLYGSITEPSGSSVDLTTLDVSWSMDPNDETNPDSSGNFTTTADLTGPTVITALVEDTSAANYSYAVFLEALALPGDYSVTLNSFNTAVALTWDGLGVQGLVDDGSLDDARTMIEGLADVVDLGTLLETKLAADPFILSKSDSTINSAKEKAILAAANAMQSALNSGSLTARSYRSLSYRAAQAATVTPSGKVDDLQVIERSGTGNINIINDTQLYVSAKVTAEDGTVLQPHITGLSGMAGPQGWGLLFWASTTELQQPKGQNCTVQIITPGTDREYEPQIGSSANYTVFKWLAFRTVIERVIWPPISSILSIGIDPGTLASIVMNNVTNVYDIVDNFQNGNWGDGTKGLFSAILSDVASVPPGPITKALAVQYGEDLAERVLAKMAAKIGAKLVPGIGQISLAYEVAGHLSNGINAAVAFSDLIGTDTVIEYKVEFPLQIDEVIPSKVKPDGKDKKFQIKGVGFSDITRGWLSKTTLRPEITFTDNKGYTTTMKPDFTNANGTQMTVTVPGWFLDEYTEGPLDVSVHHPTDQAGSVTTKNDAVTIVTKVEISSISPDSGGVGTPATVYGAGFSNIISDNEVQIGSATALISSASDSALDVVIPTSLTTGTYQVKARSRFDGIWSDWSNTVSYEVIEGEIQITVSDNGGAKDDAFALYVDGLYKGTMYATNSDYTDIYTMSLSPGPHTAMLVGVEAPDSVGTYSISFSGVTGVQGDSTSGSDLVPGVRKYYTFTVSVGSTTSAFKVHPAPYKPKVLDPETMLMRKAR
ncbi:MAG: IPT/TIG domain-containing protein [Proteobacteria bacterium]|nr:IPT/TIG domain-containing protein [Pseudomonadota bacterium]MBU1687620.1 IPT/TIG domain-containing protein [Pseudomonadota bacterium]